MRRNTVLSAAVLAALTPAVWTSAAAQEAGAQSLRLEEITVTARRVEESLMEVPLAITAFSSQDIQARNIKQLNDVAAFTPSFSFDNQQGGSGRNDRSTNSLVFRGLFLNLNVGLNAGGQLFIDGAPVVGAQTPNITDVARVEVLKGPQSAYFGRSTFSGALNFVTRDPGDEFQGSVSAEYSRFDSSDVALSLEGPLAENLSGRFSARRFSQGGQYKNFADPTQKLGERSTDYFSGTLLYTPTEALRVRAFLNYFENKDGPPAQAALKGEYRTGIADRDGNCRPLTPIPSDIPANSPARWGTYCGGTLPKVSQLPPELISGDYSTNTLVRNTLFNPPASWLLFDPNFVRGYAHRRQTWQSNVRIDYETSGGYTLTSLTALNKDKNSNFIDLNYRDAREIPNPLPLTPTRLPNRQTLLISQGRFENWSTELRLTSPQEERFRWTAGLNYLDAKTPGGPVYGQLIVGPVFTSSITEATAKTPAVFGATYFDFTPDLTLSAEARYQRDRISQTLKIGGNGLPPTGAAAEPFKETFTSFTPRISLDYRYAPDSTVYATYSRGVRPGGFNAALRAFPPDVLAGIIAAQPDAAVAFKEEKLVNYELGLKSTWLDGRARTTVALFYMEWLDGQAGTSVPVPGATNLVNITVNSGDATLRGVEFEGAVQATDNLLLQATVGYNKTKIKEFGLCGDCANVYGIPDATGNELPTVPKLTWTASAEYTNRISAEYDWYTRVDQLYTGKKQVDFANVSQVAARNVTNLRVGMRGDRLSLEAYVENLFDDDNLVHGLQGTDLFQFVAGPEPGAREIRVSLPDRRRYGVRATYSF